MPHLPLTPHAIVALADLVTGGSGSGATERELAVYRSGTKLETFFANCDVDFQLAGRSRVTAVRELLTALNRKPDSLHCFARIIEAALDPSIYPDAATHSDTLQWFNERLRSSGLEVRESGGSYRLLQIGTCAPVAAAVGREAVELDFDSVKRDMDRALGQAQSDPEGALTAACSMVESVCRCLLQKMGKPLPTVVDISHLVKEVQKHLRLSPERDDIAPDIKQILGGLANVANGIGALRTHAGDAHGRDRRIARVDTRIAKLAIHAASTITLFFIETWKLHHARSRSTAASSDAK